jgi:hypothetical protein
MGLIGCTGLLAESGIPRTQPSGDGSGEGHTTSRSDGPSTTTTPSTPCFASGPPPPAPVATGQPGPVALTIPAGHCQAGTVCPFAGSPSVRRSAVNRRHGSAGHSRAGTVCLIAGSPTVRRLAVTRQAGSAGRYQAVTVCLTAGTRCFDGPGVGLPAGICWALPGGHRVSDRWNSTSCRAGGGPRSGFTGRCQAGSVCLAAGERRSGGPGTRSPGQAPLGATRRAQYAQRERCGHRAHQ